VTDREQQEFEAELRRARPASLPEALRSQLVAAAQPKKAPREAPWPASAAWDWRRVLRLLVPATAAVALMIVVVGRGPLRPGAAKGPLPVSQQQAAAASHALKPDDVQIAQKLVSSFDTLARLPSGEPVRFRCRQWLDQVTLSDKAHGLVFEQRTPRVEVVPVGFETY